MSFFPCWRSARRSQPHLLTPTTDTLAVEGAAAVNVSDRPCPRTSSAKRSTMLLSDLLLATCCACQHQLVIR
jgi:hypothetical protein